MGIVHVYDIAGNAWFSQFTSTEAISHVDAMPGDYPLPTGRMEMCSVTASAEDNSSHNIYIYGGWDGSGSAVESDVWILSLPAFVWVSANPKTVIDPESNTRGISKHRCQKIHDRYMVAYRGKNVNDICDSDRRFPKLHGMTILDMSSLQWTTKVKIDNQKYLIPSELYFTIGGK